MHLQESQGRGFSCGNKQGGTRLGSQVRVPHLMEEVSSPGPAGLQVVGGKSSGCGNEALRDLSMSRDGYSVTCSISSMTRRQIPSKFSFAK